MFGFGKKKQYDNDQQERVLAGIALGALHETQKELLEEFDKFLVDNYNANHPHCGTTLYYTGQLPNSLEIMSYAVGFNFGVCQSYEKDEAYAGGVVAHFAASYEKTTQNYLKILGLSYYSKTFFDIFSDRWNKKIFQTDDDASAAFIAGLAEGKDFADVDRNTSSNYSLLKDPATVSKFNLTEFRSLMKGWMSSVLGDSAIMAMMTFPIHWSDDEVDAELLRLGLN